MKSHSCPWAVIALPLAVAPSFSYLQAQNRDPWIQTGEGVREKTLAWVHVQAYTISHWVQKQPSILSKSALNDLEADKKFSITMLRNVRAGQMKGMFRDAYALNGYCDKARIDQFLSALTRDLVKGDHITITYAPLCQATTLTLQGGGTAVIPGREFMRATWSLWFGQSEQPALGDALVSKLRSVK